MKLNIFHMKNVNPIFYLSKYLILPYLARYFFTAVINKFMLIAIQDKTVQMKEVNAAAFMSDNTSLCHKHAFVTHDENLCSLLSAILYRHLKAMLLIRSFMVTF